MKFAKSTLSILLAVILMVGLLPMSVFADSGKSYLALGDSITTGYGLEEAEAEAFPVLLTSLLNGDTDTYTLQNMAVNGDTTVQLLEHLTDETEYREAVAAADVLTITIGGNDLMALLYEFLAGELDMTPEEVRALLEAGEDMEALTMAANAINNGAFEPTEEEIEAVVNNLWTILSEIRSLNPEAVIAVATQYDPYEKLADQIGDIYGMLGMLDRDDLKALADAILKLSDTIESALTFLNTLIQEGEDYLVADTYTLFAASQTNLCNARLVTSPSISVNLDFHPTAEGHAVIADCMADVLSEVLEEEPPAAYTVSFDANGGDGEMYDVYGVSGEYLLPECGFTAPADKQFKGWATSADGDVLTENSIAVNADVTLYAVWEDIPSEDVRIPGDANGDGYVSGKDLILLRQYMAEMDVTLDEDAADVNGDGYVSGKDVILMRQYLAEWDVELQ